MVCRAGPLQPVLRHGLLRRRPDRDGTRRHRRQRHAAHAGQTRRVGPHLGLRLGLWLCRRRGVVDPHAVPLRRTAHRQNPDRYRPDLRPRPSAEGGHPRRRPLHRNLVCDLHHPVLSVDARPGATRLSRHYRRRPHRMAGPQADPRHAARQPQPVAVPSGLNALPRRVERNVHLRRHLCLRRAGMVGRQCRRLWHPRRRHWRHLRMARRQGG
ncbi:hypothetical protein GALL_526870 [mine drainage metagenome]|uniref:Uncharacterized protein n=1 Tax=mine drainage metagenome TaxID=410659 RepID=A0A1J5PD51_9ZZZZ